MPTISNIFPPCAVLLCCLLAGPAFALPTHAASLPSAMVQGGPRTGLSLSSPDLSPSQTSEYARIVGIVTDSLGRPIANAMVEISNTTSGERILRRTSSAGEFSADSLIEGETYTVAVARLGFAIAETAPFVASATARGTVTVVMRARPAVMIPAKNPQKPEKVSDSRLASRSID